MRDAKDDVRTEVKAVTFFMKMDLFDEANTKLHRTMILSGYQMAILPIDLQTLYGQLEKVSKTAVQQQALIAIGIA